MTCSVCVSRSGVIKSEKHVQFPIASRRMKIKEIPHGFSFPSILCNSQWGGSSIFISRPQLDGSLATTWGRNHPQRGKRQIKCRGNGRWWLKRFPLKRIDLVFMLGCAVNIKKLIWIFREGKRFFVYSTVNTSTFVTFLSIGKYYKFQKKKEKS